DPPVVLPVCLIFVCVTQWPVIGDESGLSHSIRRRPANTIPPAVGLGGDVDAWGIMPVEFMASFPRRAMNADAQQRCIRRTIQIEPGIANRNAERSPLPAEHAARFWRQLLSLRVGCLDDHFLVCIAISLCDRRGSDGQKSCRQQELPVAGA